MVIHVKASVLLRLSGAASLLAGLWTLGTLFFPVETDDVAWYLVVGKLLLMFALFGIYAAQAEQSGLLGLLGFILTSSGNVLFLLEGSLGDEIIIIAGVPYAIGLIVFALGTLRGRVFWPWIPALWIASILIGIPPFFLELPSGAQYIPGGVLYGLSLVGAGYQLWARRLGRTPI